MFSFHKPKVYRSTQGCCICKAKSSSSRFTDSKKYELDFIECFQLEVARQGEICNACVLLVKRYKRLPPGSDRHWGHVVDARVGPGLKSMSKFKKRKEEQLAQKLLHEEQQKQQQITTVSACGEKFGKIYKKTKVVAKSTEATEAARSENGGDAGASSPSNGSSDEIASPAHTLSDSEPMTTESALFCHETLGDDILPSSGPASPVPRTCSPAAGSVAPVARIPSPQPRPIAATATAVVPKPSARITRKKPAVVAAPTTFAVRRIARKSARPVRNNRIGGSGGVGQFERGALLLTAADGWLERRTCCGLVYEHQLISAVLLNADTLQRDACVHHGRRHRATQPEDAPAENGLDRLLRAAQSPTAGQLSAAAPAAAPAASGQLVTAAIPPPSAPLDAKPVAVSSVGVGRKIKLTQNALQFLRKTARDRALGSTAAPTTSATASTTSAAAAAVLSAVPGASTTATASAQPVAVNKLLGKFVTITGDCTLNYIGKQQLVQPTTTATATATATAAADAAAVSHETTSGHKFNDNSSDSGYDETMLGEANGPKATDACVTTIMQQIVLANGMKLNVKPMPPNLTKKIVILPKTPQQLAAGKTISVLTANGSVKLQELLQKQQQQQQSKSPPGAAQAAD